VISPAIDQISRSVILSFAFGSRLVLDEIMLDILNRLQILGRGCDPALLLSPRTEVQKRCVQVIDAAPSRISRDGLNESYSNWIIVSAFDQRTRTASDQLIISPSMSSSRLFPTKNAGSPAHLY
jgi:hypothetical protein